MRVPGSAAGDHVRRIQHLELVSRGWLDLPSFTRAGSSSGRQLDRIADRYDRLHAHRQQRTGRGNEFRNGHYKPVRLREREQLGRHGEFFLHAGTVSVGLQFQHQPAGASHVSLDAVWQRGIRL